MYLGPTRPSRPSSHRTGAGASGRWARSGWRGESVPFLRSPGRALSTKSSTMPPERGRLELAGDGSDQRRGGLGRVDAPERLGDVLDVASGALLREGRVAGRDGLDDRPVLLDRLAGPTRYQDGAELVPDVLGLQA